MSFFSWLRKRTSTRPLHGRAQHRPAARSFQPQLEALEDRMLPSTYYAATASDLIADINAANKAGGANTIVLTAPTTSPYVLTAVNNTTNGANGLPVISTGGKKVAADNLTIVGNGDTIERSSGTPFRLFDVASGASLTLENVTLLNGYATVQQTTATSWSAEGGAIYNQGTLVLSGATIGGSTAVSIYTWNAAGGGVWSNGSLTVENSTVIEGNSAVASNGSDIAFGGGLYIAGGTANISASTISNNRAQGGGEAGSSYGSAWGGGVYVAAGNVTLSGDILGAMLPSTSGGNVAQGGDAYGGGLCVAGGTVTLTNDTVQNNETSVLDLGEGGGIFIASGAVVYLDSFTLNNTLTNYNYADSYTESDIWGPYTLLP
jgi:hypothetical protein